MTDLRQVYLDYVIFRANMLLDRGVEASFQDVYSAIHGGKIIEWMGEKGADMSILLSETMWDSKALVVEALTQVATSRKGEERSKLGVKHHGLCLLIALALEAKAVFPPMTAPYLDDVGTQ